MKGNKIYLILEKYPCQWETNDYLYIVIGKDINAVIQICDIDIESSYIFQEIKETNASSLLLLECCYCDCGHVDIFTINDKLKKYKHVFKERIYSYREKSFQDQIQKIIKIIKKKW